MWVARDEDGELYLHTDKPIRHAYSGMFVDTVFGHSVKIKETLFPKLKWEDEPIEIKLVEV
jgi:hypothetical protein